MLKNRTKSDIIYRIENLSVNCDAEEAVCCSRFADYGKAWVFL